jgi:hypothetical protein
MMAKMLRLMRGITDSSLASQKMKLKVELIDDH